MRYDCFFLVCLLFPTTAVAQGDLPDKDGAAPDGEAEAREDLQRDLHHARLDAALDEYNRTVQQEVEKVASSAHQLLERATREGNLDLAKQAQRAESHLRDNGLPPEDTFMRTQREEASRKITRAARKLLATYNTVSKEILKSGDLEGAEAVANEGKEIASDSDRWRVGAHSPRFAQAFPRPNAIAKGPAVINSIGMRMRRVPTGTFWMGENDVPIESPRHRVRLTSTFHIGEHEVTNAQWRKVMGDPPSAIKDDTHPVESLTWDEANEFCRKLSEMPEEQAAGRVYRLPTEAEWEYACRAGADTSFTFGDEEVTSGRLLSRHGWFAMNSGKAWLTIPANQLENVRYIREGLKRLEGSTHPVGQKAPNSLGIYDMHGNVCELCDDCFAPYQAHEVVDPVGMGDPNQRVVKGGGWESIPWSCRSSSRKGFPVQERNCEVGFRVVFTSP